jgi:hypothetical protein
MTTVAALVSIDKERVLPASGAHRPGGDRAALGRIEAKVH